ncbi:MAG: hypothetical protein GY943_32095 [Chloroflexi bacterium]|nr:hypothetical protein [Chloroflexota bacterium]
MESSEVSIAQNDNDNDVLWINHRLIKALLAGLIIGSGLSIAALFEINYLIQPKSTTQDFVINIVIPIVIIYFWADSVKKY